MHPAAQHRTPADGGGWVGIDRGLAAFVVAATGDGTEIARITDAPRALATGLACQRRLATSLSRKQKGSHNRRDAAAKLARHHHRSANVRRHFLHQVANQLVKTHDRLVIEDLNTAGMLRNHRLARAIADASWAEFARLLHYKQAWRGGQVRPPWPTAGSPPAGSARPVAIAAPTSPWPIARLPVQTGTLDRDLNAAINLARWGEQNHHRTPDPQARGRATNARRQDGPDQHLRVGETSLDDAGTDVHAAPAA